MLFGCFPLAGANKRATQGGRLRRGANKRDRSLELMALNPMMVIVSYQISGPPDAVLAVAGAIFSALIGQEGHVRSLIRLNEV